MSSGTESDSRSGSASPPGVAPTPGHGLDRSASNSPNFENKSQSERFSRSRSKSADSQRSRASRSGSSNRSGSQRDGSQKSGSGSDKSRRSGSASSNDSKRSGSNASRKSRSRSGSNTSRKSGSRSRSGSNASNRSGSGSRRSGSAVSKKSGSRSRSGSPASKRSGSRSRSGSPASKKSGSRSRSGSRASRRSGTRSGSAASKRSGSRSRSGSRTSKRSGSAGSNRSRSRSKGSSRSGSVASRRSRSRSKSRASSRRKSDGSRSGSNSPNLEIDEGETENQRKDSESEDDVPKKRKKTIASDSEEDGGKEVSAAAIFGDADDISSEEEKDKEQSDKEEEKRMSDEERRSDDETEKPEGEQDEDKENEPEVIPETRIDVRIPKIGCNLGREIHFVKLPNFLSVETRPFDPETYEDEIDEEETLDEEGRARLKLKVENTIRWREVMDDEGNFKKESNARMVKWSDGSYSLHLGSEIFDVYKQPLQGDHNHFFIRQGTGLQGQAVFRTKLGFRPHSTESFTHRKMTLSLADRSQKTSGIKILSQVGIDPDHDRATLLKKEEEKLRQSVRNTKPRKKEPKAHNTSNSYHEDGSDDEGAISLNAIKNKYKPGSKGAAAAIYSSDEEGSDIETKSKKQDKSKVLNYSDSESE